VFRLSAHKACGASAVFIIPAFPAIHVYFLSGFCDLRAEHQGNEEKGV